LPENSQDVRSILIVEDSQIVARDIEKKLARLGYRVAGSSVSGRGAVDKAAATRPDLVLMDIRLQGKMDGIEAAALIREQFDIPVVYLTAYADDETVERAKQTAPLGYLVKPFDESTLRTAIEVALYRASMERELRKSERWLTETLRCMGDATIVTDENGHVRFMNAVAESVTGWTQARALGQPWWDVAQLLDSADRRPTRAPVERALQARRPTLSTDVLLTDRLGSETLVEITAAPITEANQTSLGIVIALRDASERSIAEQAVRRSEELQRAVLDSTENALFLLSVDGRFLLANAAAGSLLGIPPRELVGQRLTDVLSPGVSNLFAVAQTQALQGGHPASFECSLTSAGERADYVVRVVVCRLPGDDRALGVLAQLREVRSVEGDAPASAAAQAVGPLSHEIDRIAVGLADALGEADEDAQTHLSRLRTIARELAELHWAERSKEDGRR